MVMRFTVVQHILYIFKTAEAVLLQAFSFPSSAWECSPESSSFPYKAS
jgi:hypothetical protein